MPYLNTSTEQHGERSPLAEWVTRLGRDPKGVPFQLYGGMVKKKYSN